MTGAVIITHANPEDCVCGALRAAIIQVRGQCLTAVACVARSYSITIGGDGEDHSECDPEQPQTE